MTYEQLVQIKVRATEAECMVAFGIAGLFALAAIAWVVVTSIKYRNDDRWLAFFPAVFALLIAGAAACSWILRDTQARGELAGYQLVELRK